MNSDDIYSAHCVRGIPPSEILTPFPSIRSLLNSQVRRYGDRIFLINHQADGNRTELSYEDFSRKVFQGANYLKDQDVQFGDRVAPVSSRGVSALQEVFAIWTLGAVAVLNPETGEEERDRDRFEELTGDFSQEFRIGRKSRIDDDALLVYARTPEEKVRGIRLTHYDLLVEAMAVARRQEISDGSVVVSGLPAMDITAIAGCVMPTLYEGGTLVISERLSESVLTQLIKEEKASSAFVGRSFLAHCRDNPEVSREFLTSLDHLTCAVQGLTVEMVQGIRKILGRPVILGLSVPEATSFASLVPVPKGTDSLMSWLERQMGLPAGNALHPTEISVLDEDGNERGEKKVGEIVLRGHTVMKGYLEDDGATAHALRSGWFHTGERGFYRLGRDGDRYLFVTS
ncbi:MAG: class I adenylate-forming enzyme family protein [Fidelibacterota bacterium]